MRIPAALINPARRALPAFTGRPKPVGATRSTRHSAMPVVGSPSMRVVRDSDGSVRTLLRRNMTHADLLSEADLRPLQALLGQVEGTAKNLSQGTLSKADLKARNHPYGRGMKQGKRRGKIGRLPGSGRGVSNMAIVNKHSGKFAGAWSSELMRDKSGVTLSLENDAPVSQFLAFGTRRMKAHGPFSTAVAKHLTAIDSEWRRLARVATARNNALEQLGMGQRLKANNQ